MGNPVSVRFVDDELEAIDKAAIERGIGRSAFIRAAVQAQLNGKPIPPRKPHAIERGDMREVNRLAVNVNQIAKSLNSMALEGRGLGVSAIIEDGRTLYGNLNRVVVRMVEKMG